LIELSTTTALDYLRGRGWPCDGARVTELGGGVSNTVLLVEAGSRRMVLKQALGRLRVQEEWLSDPHRALRECRAMEALASHLPEHAVPAIYFADEENFLYGMEAAPADARDWKSLLLAGEIRLETAETAARLQGAVIRATWQSPDWEEAFGDQRIFGELRLDPYYHFTASRHPDLAPHFDSLIAGCRSRRVSMVHGDWSPKNFLVSGGRFTAIDFEVAHFGDPSFDAAFLLNHLLLKMRFRPALRGQYAAAALRFREVLLADLPAGCEWFEEATIRHLGGLHLARIDGKSPAEYIRDAGMKQEVRDLARRLMRDPPKSLEEVFR
jgi:5-methylthioribose kinase